jgi:hypothetical protein
MRPPMLSVCDRLRPGCVPSPHTPHAVAARASGLERPCLAAREGKGRGWRTARQPITDVDSQLRLERTHSAQHSTNVHSPTPAARVMPASNGQDNGIVSATVPSPACISLLASRRPAATAGAHTVPTRRHQSCGNAPIAGITSIRPHDPISREGAFRRESNQVFHSSQISLVAREPGETEALSYPRFPRSGPKKTRRWGGGTDDRVCRLSPKSSEAFAPVLPNAVALAPRKTVALEFWRRPVQKSDAAVRASQTRPCVFLARRCWSAAELEKLPSESRTALCDRGLTDE